jgi:hypothetical protein
MVPPHNARRSLGQAIENTGRAQGTLAVTVTFLQLRSENTESTAYP